MKGMELSRAFFLEAAEPLLKEHFPGLSYSVGLLGYGSDVLGYDDETSRDHMWGPRFYLFLSEADLHLKPRIQKVFSEGLPYTFRGFDVNFSPPDPADHGVRHPVPLSKGQVDPLVWITTLENFLLGELGQTDAADMNPLTWLSLSEHRLLTIAAGRLFADGLGLRPRLLEFSFYPEAVRLYLAASHWTAVASEQAFVRRTADVGDEMGSRIVCARICERLMRLCFLYKRQYAPYSKWLGTAFSRLDVPSELKERLQAALAAQNPAEREEHLVAAESLTAALHNETGLTEPVAFSVENYFSREIKVIRAEKFAAAAAGKLSGTGLEQLPLIGSMSALPGISDFSDDPAMFLKILDFYQMF